MLNNQENYSKFEVEQAKRDIKSLVKEKSKFVKLDFSKQEDIDKFFGDEKFSENGLERLDDYSILISRVDFAV